MVTINEEFVATEQMNNCASSEQPGAVPSGPQSSQPIAVPSAKTTTDSAASSDAEDVAEENGSSPSMDGGSHPGQEQPAKHGRKGHDNHHSGKNQRSKPKQQRAQHGAHAHSQRAAPAKDEQTAAATPSAPAAPAAPTATPVAPAVAANNSHPVGPALAPARAANPVVNSAPFPHLEAVSRVLALPIVDSGVNIVSGVYSKVKNVNPVVQWSFGTAEGAVRSSLERSLSLLGPGPLSALSALSGPISVVDSLLCRGLDVVEHSVPIITLPPELLMNAGRDYMSMRVVAPVLRMTATNAHLADSIAARALDSADRYVDKYLPGDAATENGDAVGAGAPKGGAALQRADRLSRKLQRRITRRTLLEARALRRDTENTLHTLVTFAETLVKDPRAFVEQCRAVWSHLSENEPENQVPPETLEERLALLVREVARRVVHLANFTAASANTEAVSGVANNVLKSVREEGGKVMTFAQHQLQRVHVSQVLGDVNTFTHNVLERLAHLLAGLRNSTYSVGQRFPHAGTNNIAIVN